MVGRKHSYPSYIALALDEPGQKHRALGSENLVETEVAVHLYHCGTCQFLRILIEVCPTSSLPVTAFQQNFFKYQRQPLLSTSLPGPQIASTSVAWRRLHGSESRPHSAHSPLQSWFPLFFFNSSPHSRNGILTEPGLAL